MGYLLVGSMKYLSTMIRLKRLDSVKRKLQIIEVNRLTVSSFLVMVFKGGIQKPKR